MVADQVVSGTSAIGPGPCAIRSTPYKILTVKSPNANSRSVRPEYLRLPQPSIGKTSIIFIRLVSVTVPGNHVSRPAWVVAPWVSRPTPPQSRTRAQIRQPPVFVYANRVRLTLTYNPNRNPGSEPVQTFRLDSHHEHRRPHQFNPHPFYLHNTNQKQVD
jgi:hypothetical protein